MKNAFEHACWRMGLESVSEWASKEHKPFEHKVRLLWGSRRLTVYTRWVKSDKRRHAPDAEHILLCLLRDKVVKGLEVKTDYEGALKRFLGDRLGTLRRLDKPEVKDERSDDGVRGPGPGGSVPEPVDRKAGDEVPPSADQGGGGPEVALPAVDDVEW